MTLKTDTGIQGGSKMNFTISELEIIYQYAAQTKAETLRGLKEIIPAMNRKMKLKMRTIFLSVFIVMDKGLKP